MLIHRMAASFGQLQNHTLELKDGLNIIQAPNEAGKSTWCAFLTAMLYGINSRERDRGGFMAEKNRYAPWSGAPMAGRVDCRWDGRDITLMRATRRQSSPMGEFRAIYTGTGDTVPDLTGQTCGETLLGVSREVFERSAFIRQAGLAVTQDTGLERRIAALITSGQEDTSYTEAAAALDFGIRIVHLSCAGKPNLFYSQPDDLSDGLATEAGWRIYGGHRFWSSPESTRSYYPDNAPVACELLADGVCLRQRTDPWTGFEKTLILRFLPDGRLSAEHILTNRNPQTVQAAAWGVCTLRGGGTARIPFPGGTAGEYTPGRVLSLWGQTSLADERLQFGPEEICARHLPRGTSLKLGVYTAKGKITAENLGQRLTVSCEVHPIAQCADHGCNVELYLNPDVMELETLGVLARLAPGQSTHHTEFWTLEPLSEG